MVYSYRNYASLFYISLRYLFSLHTFTLGRRFRVLRMVKILSFRYIANLVDVGILCVKRKPTIPSIRYTFRLVINADDLKK